MTSRIALRRFRKSDFSFFIAWTQAKEVWKATVIGDYHLVEASDPGIKAWFTRDLLANHHAFVIERTSDAHPIGTVGLKSIVANEAEIQITIGEVPEWGKGYGREAIQLLSRHAFVEMKLDRILGKVLRTNSRALAFYQKLGFIVSDTPPNMVTVSLDRMRYLANQASSAIGTEAAPQPET